MDPNAAPALPKCMVHGKADDLGMKYLYDGTQGLGDSLHWEWRYVHDELELKPKELHKFLPRLKAPACSFMSDLQVDPAGWEYSHGTSKAEGQHKEHMFSTRAFITMLIFMLCRTQQTRPLARQKAWELLRKMIAMAIAAIPTRAMLIVLLTAGAGVACSVSAAVGLSGHLTASLEPVLDSARPEIYHP